MFIGIGIGITQTKGGGGGPTAGQLATLATLRAASAAALISNPVDNADMASPPTITQAGTHNAALTVTANFVDTPAKFRISPGNKYGRTTTKGLYIGTANLSPSTNGNLSGVTSLSPALVNNGENEVCYTIDFVATGQIVELALRVTGDNVMPYRVIVDNHFVARDGIANTGQYVSMDFGSSATRSITVEVQMQSFLGVAVSAGGSITAPADQTVKAAFTGDSITESISSGETIAYVYDGWASTFSKRNGINSMRNAAVGGTGYWNTFGGSRSKIFDQMDYWISGDTYDLIGFAGGYNDQNQVANATTAANALACWQRARAAQPNALILVTGIPGERTGPSAALLATENALKAQFDAWADPFSIFLPISTDPEGPWIYGTGYVGSTNGTGNSDTLVSSDGIHPSRAGRLFIGDKANSAYRAKLQQFP